MTARMIPSTLPPEIRSDPKRSAETTIYDLLASDPILTGATVFYSCEWMGLDGDLLRDGEADFVIAHPQIGFLVLEVKGGRVRRSVADGKWTTKDRNGQVFEIENPVRQAMKSKKIILKALKKRWPGNAPWLSARHGVILPHCSKPANVAQMGAAAPLEIFAFREDLSNLGARLLQMMVWKLGGERETFGGLGSAGIAMLEDFYGRDIDFTPRLSSVIDECEAAIEKLTETQYRYLDFMGATKRALIQGGAGTGKTVLAAEKARRAARADRRVLMLCFNRPLLVQLRRELAGSTASVATFHEFCARMCRSKGINLDAERLGCEDRYFWSVRLPELLTDIGLDIPPEQYDDLIIDEGQDFKSAWVEALGLFLDPQGSLYVFRDDFQNIYGGDDAAAALQAEPLELTENVRNTQAIFRVGGVFRKGNAQTCLGPEGVPVSWVTCDRNRTLRTVERELGRLLTADDISPGDIAVLCGCGAEMSVTRQLPTLAGRPWKPADELAEDCIVVDSIMRFKGLDRPVVILCEIEEADEEIAYVGLTRAKSHLVVVGDEASVDRLGRAEAAKETACARN
ncbi:MAG: NERD domain-containing protein [Pseudomonadota bacterium]